MKSRHLDKYISDALEGGTKRLVQSADTVLDRRDAERVHLRTYVSYVSDERIGLSRGQGWLIDLSKTGCRIAGPALPVGTAATIILYFQDDKDPLSVCGATVTWSDGHCFGVRFPTLSSADRQRLQGLVLRFATLESACHGHTAFRLV